MDGRNTIVVLTPIVGHLMGQLAIPRQLVEEEFRVKLAAVSVLVDFLNVQGSLGAVRVPDLEVDGVDGAVSSVVGDR